MIGPGWSGEERERPRANGDSKRKIAVVTGTRAEFGLLRPVMHAVQEQDDLELMVIAAGAHLVQPARTYYEIKQEFDVIDSVPMQTVGRVGRWHDVESTGKGIARFARSFERLRPDIVLVLGDRIEAFAAASAASIGGLPVAHVHGGDRAEGVADEAMRHAITKLAHLHFPATEESAGRIQRMGEAGSRVRVVGSPAIDELRTFEAMDDESAQKLGDPEVVFLMHPVGRPDEQEEAVASSALTAIGERRTLCLHPNLDPGRTGILRAMESASAAEHVHTEEHLPRSQFVGLLKRLAEKGGLLVGNSSAGLIEAGAIGLPAVDIGPRQSGRERGTNVFHAKGEHAGAIVAAIGEALEMDRASITHPFGEGESGIRIARALADVNLADSSLTRKRFVDG